MKPGGATAAFATFLVISATPVRAANQVISFEGLWHVDLERSNNPYRSDTKSVTLRIIRDDGQVYEASETVMRVSGETTTETVRTPVDGKFHPVVGSLSRSSVAIVERVGPSMTLELDAPPGFHGRVVCNLSTDLNTLTCDESVTDLQGRNTVAKAVYVRNQPRRP